MPILTSGQLIRETYEVERFLGEGAFAEVYRVKHRYLGRQALKLFKRPGMTCMEIDNVLNEAVILSRIGHPNVIRVFDANVFDSPSGKFGYFTMEYVAGGSLDKFWNSFGPDLIPISTTVGLIKQICRGISIGHSESPPIVHRDVKPQNVLVGYEGEGLRVRVSDFGLAKSVNPLTMLASARGTLCFKAPEVFEDPTSDSCAGDVWAIGCTLYLLLTDQLPFPETVNSKLINHKLFKKKVENPSSINQECDDLLGEICLKALAIDPKQRFCNAKELLAELDKWEPRSGSTNPQLHETSKESLGRYSPINEDLGKKLVSLALELAKKPNKLFQAADVMEEAFLKYPKIRKDHENLVKLWRRGISS